MRVLNKIILHCSDSDYAHHDNVEAIRHWHVKERGYSDVGYHFIITKDGTIHRCRPLTIAGAHCKDHNTDSIGICLTGKHEFSDKQFRAMKELCGMLQIVHGEMDIEPHNKYDVGRTCPNFDIREHMSYNKVTE